MPQHPTCSWIIKEDQPKNYIHFYWSFTETARQDATLKGNIGKAFKFLNHFPFFQFEYKEVLGQENGQERNILINSHSDSCYAQVGRQAGPTLIECSSIFSLYNKGYGIGTKTHEILHVLGISHAQKNPNASQYITVNDSYPIKESSFFLSKYDPFSIMHYSLSSKIVLRDQQSILENLQGQGFNKKTSELYYHLMETEIGQRFMLSGSDITELSQIAQIIDPTVAIGKLPILALIPDETYDPRKVLQFIEIFTDPAYTDSLVFNNSSMPIARNPVSNPNFPNRLSGYLIVNTSLDYFASSVNPFLTGLAHGVFLELLKKLKKNLNLNPRLACIANLSHSISNVLAFIYASQDLIERENAMKMLIPLLDEDGFIYEAYLLDKLTTYNNFSALFIPYVVGILSSIILTSLQPSLFFLQVIPPAVGIFLANLSISGDFTRLTRSSIGSATYILGHFLGSDAIYLICQGLKKLTSYSPCRNSSSSSQNSNPTKEEKEELKPSNANTIETVSIKESIHKAYTGISWCRFWKALKNFGTNKTRTQEREEETISISMTTRL